MPIQTVVAVIDAAALAPRPGPSRRKPAPRQQRLKRPSPLRLPPLPSRGPRYPPRSGSRCFGASRQRPGNGDKVRSSPLVRRIAREHNIDLAQVPGTGAGGRVSKQRHSGRGRRRRAAASAAATAPAAAPPPPPPPPAARLAAPRL